MSNAARDRHSLSEPASDLFRRETQNSSTNRVVGSVVLQAPPSLTVIAVVVTATIALATAIVVLAPFPRVERVHGILVPESGLVTITTSRGGVVVAAPARDGQSVEAGQIVAVVRVSSDSRAGDAGAAMSASLRSEAAAADELAALELLKLEEDREDAVKSRSAASADIAQVERQIGLQDQRLALVRSQLDRAEGLARQGFYPQRQLDENRSALLTAQQTRLGYERELQGLRRALDEVDHQLEAMSSRVRESRARARQGQSQLEQRAVTVDLEDQYTIRASAAGRLTGVVVHSGQWIAAGSPIATVLPDRTRLEVEAQIPSRARGWVERGQPVTVMFDAFPYQRFGSLTGTVVSVAEALTPTTGSESQSPGYRVRIALPRQHMTATGRPVPLQAGMAVESRIILERRTLMHVMFEPIFAAGRSRH